MEKVQEHCASVNYVKCMEPGCESHQMVTITYNFNNTWMEVCNTVETSCTNKKCTYKKRTARLPDIFCDHEEHSSHVDLQPMRLSFVKKGKINNSNDDRPEDVMIVCQCKMGHLFMSKFKCLYDGCFYPLIFCKDFSTVNRKNNKKDARGCMLCCKSKDRSMAPMEEYGETTRQKFSDPYFAVVSEIPMSQKEISDDPTLRRMVGTSCPRCFTDQVVIVTTEGIGGNSDARFDYTYYCRNQSCNVSWKVEYT